MTDDILPLLAVHEYFRGLPADALEEVARDARVAHHPAGTVVHEADAVLDTIGFVLRGRLKAVRVDARGVETLFRVIDRGEQYGMMVGALAEPVPIRVVALEPTTVLVLDYERAMDLTARFPDLRRLWLKTFAGSLRKHFFGTAGRRAPMLLALVHESPATRVAAGRLVDRLRGLGEKLAVFGDPAAWRPLPDVRFRPLLENGDLLDPTEVRRQATEWQDATRIVFDVPADIDPARLGQVMELADRVVFFAPATSADALVHRLRALDVTGRGWRDKVRVAWLLGGGPPVGPAADLSDLAARDFKIADPPPGRPYGPATANGLERLVHDLRNVRIGVALGGGAARGMTHLGVLKALERGGVVVDMIAGTSAGAMTGILYAAGLDCDYSAARFAADLRPSWVFRNLPRGDHWYLLYKYRRGHFDPMLRTYLRDWRLEQLAVPCRSVTVDLVGGNSVVRDHGDAVHAILESINLPVLSVPIVRGGQALIDGGLVNNIPADVLVREGCNFVIAVSVTAQMEKAFGDITPDRPPRRGPSVVQTILRSLLVQNHSLNAFGVQPADVVIAPDVTGFDLTAFTHAREMAAVGEAAAAELVPRICRLLNRMDPQLFPLLPGLESLCIASPVPSPPAGA
ncbi:patatin-like phospholipase family protein [bacterium]|nr:patatin-like phospholipase family protein [bacterium]